MLDKLIRFLGGFTREEYRSLDKEYDTQRQLVLNYRARVDFLEKELQEIKEERKSLQELIFKRFGISYSDDTSCGNLNESFQPIDSGKSRWSNLRARLERDDALRAKGAN